jgi:hypothetical protein
VFDVKPWVVMTPWSRVVKKRLSLRSAMRDRRLMGIGRPRVVMMPCKMLSSEILIGKVPGTGSDGSGREYGKECVPRLKFRSRTTTGWPGFKVSWLVSVI